MRESEDGYLQIVGLQQEIVNVGGEKVPPLEIESVLLETGFIEDALVRGENNMITGQSVVADIVLVDSVDFKTVKKRIRQYCRKNLSEYKVPTKINFVDRTSVGKNLKRFSFANSHLQVVSLAETICV